MKPRGSIALVAAVLAALALGCTTVKPVPGQEMWPADAALAARASTTPEGAPIHRSTPAELASLARKHFQMGQNYLDQGTYDGARAEFLRGLAAAGAIPDGAGVDEPVRRERETLITDLSLAAVRAGRLRDGFPTQMATKSYALDFQYNDRVERWLHYWLTGGRDQMERYLERSGRYIDRVREIVREEGLPEDLAFLPVIESGYSPMAYSHMHAAGTWQFIQSTAKIYNLSVDPIVDERRDVEKATRAACQYLKKLHDEFGSWDLALAAYNCGENNVERAIARSGARDFWKLSLPSETEDYVPKFYAAMMVAKDPDYYGFRVQMEPPEKYETVYLPKPVDLQNLAQQTGVCYQDLKTCNPELLGRFTHPKSTNYPLRVPAEVHQEFMARFAALSEDAKYLTPEQVAKSLAPVKHASLKGKKGKVRGGVKGVTHVVKKGETLYAIAQKYGTTVDNLCKWNGLKKKATVRPGMRIRILS